MQSRREVSFFVIVLESGEEVLATLEAFVHHEGLRGGYFSGIGSCKDALIGYYDIEKKSTIQKEISENLEIVSCTGGLAMWEGKELCHLHAVLSDRAMRPYGGHLFRATVTATAEFYFFPSANALVRRLNDEIGLPLIRL